MKKNIYYYNKQKIINENNEPVNEWMKNYWLIDNWMNRWKK